MSSFNDLLKEQLKDPQFKAEWDALEPEYAIVQAIIDARKRSGLTQKELSDRSGINQADISRIERGVGNPSLRTIKRLASSMGMTVKLEFTPVRPTK
ncbi:MAG TPA: helix-turn-helix transcriptional regulator [Candidatus Faecousia excrementigallinarum]|uniref:Helix-turn-helix transcriptional regulator n=1 Tax=Candidatus Faecousia excrementigallinarum TaxID=2840806 RepID=A0A9D0Z4K6_9FIRM|nr:helix-turn-helix transcriptional regulator [Candidatus Faecousia excrementigallinarum]